MKRTRLLVLLPLVALVGCEATQSQSARTDAPAIRTDTPAVRTESSSAGLTMESFREDARRQRRERVKQQMNLDDKQSAAFWPIYDQYSAELKLLGDEMLATTQEYGRTAVGVTPEQADALAKRFLNLEKSFYELWSKYYGQISKATDARVATRFLQVESRILAELRLKATSGIPLMPTKDTK